MGAGTTDHPPTNSYRTDHGHPSKRHNARFTPEEMTVADTPTNPGTAGSVGGGGGAGGA